MHWLTTESRIKLSTEKDSVESDSLQSWTGLCQTLQGEKTVLIQIQTVLSHNAYEATAFYYYYYYIIIIIIIIDWSFVVLW